MCAIQKIRLVAGLLLLAVWPAWAQEVYTTRDTVLREAARFDAAGVAVLKMNTAGAITAKRGPWLEFRSAGKTGWLLITEVNFGRVSGNPYGAANLGSLFGKSSAPTTTATIGIRVCFGPGPFDSPVNEAQLALLDSYAVSTKEAVRLHAEPRGLIAIEIIAQ